MKTHHRSNEIWFSCRWLGFHQSTINPKATIFAFEMTGECAIEGFRSTEIFEITLPGDNIEATLIDKANMIEYDITFARIMNGKLKYEYLESEVRIATKA